ncbi:hypothetical protein LCGC14_2680600 [marine sediment metagenome]|uniref:Uncharacterized protein n=1 Tax=marine sediment metagenome TaxID=412755 RepID=A0A0F8ZLF3_9ZZZZ
MKIDKQTILIIALSIVVLVGGFVLLNKDTPQPEPEKPLGATGSRFHIDTTWLSAGTETSTVVATSTTVNFLLPQHLQQ